MGAKPTCRAGRERPRGGAAENDHKVAPSHPALPALRPSVQLNLLHQNIELGFMPTAAALETA
jgi:hypothetical protein